MKKITCLLATFLMLAEIVYSQQLIIKGRIRCMNQSAHSTKGAENIIVVPTFMPSRSAITASSPTGYFEFDTGLPINTLQDKQVQVYVVSRCSECKDIVKRVFISEDQDRQNKDDSKSYVTIKKWMLDNNCEAVELTALQADSLLAVIQKQPQQKLSELTNATAVTGTPALLNLLTTLSTVLVPVPAATGTFVPKSLDPGDISYGKFLFASALTHTTNTGFNFSPTRNIAEAIFWNPAAISLTKTRGNVSLLTNVKNNGKLSAFTKLTDRISLGAGAIYTRQDEFRNGFFTGNNDTNKFVDSMELNLKEYAIYITPSFRINNKLSLGFAAKSVWQQFNIPVQIVIQQNNNVTTNEFTYADIDEQHFDFDFSLLYQVTKSFQLGINAMNLAGSEFYDDAFFPGQQVIPLVNQRSYGLGMSYRYQRFNFGADFLFTDDDFYDASIGINVVPFNEGLISAGYAFKQSSYSLALRLKHFRLAYINDNDFFANEKRKGRSGILDGKLYGGFSFNF